MLLKVYSCLTRKWRNKDEKNTFLLLYGVTKDKTRSLVMKSEKEGRDEMEVTFVNGHRSLHGAPDGRQWC